jgi:prefoldin subunit 5
MSEHNDKIDRLDERLTRVEDKIDGLTSGVQQIIAMLSRLSDGG